MLNQIISIVDEIRNEYQIVGSELDGKIYYMNGNDGTEFDWGCNDRVCEFVVFHENEFGYIKLLVGKDNVIDVYVYQDGGMNPTQVLTRYYDKNPLELANFLYRVFDKNYIYDEPIEPYINAECCGEIASELIEWDEPEYWEEEEEW